jgi:dimethylamine/trimethylamine dehydrogenase
VSGPVLIFDDDRYYMASVLAEVIARSGVSVTYVTPAPLVAAWTVNTLEQDRIHRRLADLGIGLVLSARLAGRAGDSLTLECVYTSRLQQIACDTLLPVTSRLPVDALWQDLSERRDQWADHGLVSLERIGDCLAPGTIAAAVYAGHRFARGEDQTSGLDSALT